MLYFSSRKWNSMIDRENAIYLTMLLNTGHPIESAIAPLNDPDYFEEEMAELEDEDD